ncbi:MAG: UDP-glucose 4-epimerase GalE [Vampirovibrionales bacterium]|nr:UDP-glucose 4-epimerase GalE [Vampirovibrionales bacterium]
MAILITGGAGYIGSHCLKLMRQQGRHHVIVLDDLSNGHVELLQGYPLVEGSVHDVDFVTQLLRDGGVTAVIHFAAFAYVGESVYEPEKYYQNNVTGTLNLLKAMRRANVNQLIFSSTCATYGSAAQLPIQETSPQNPINPYGATKLSAEWMIRDFERAYGLRSVIFRYFNAAGAHPDGTIGEWHDPETHLIPLALQATLQQANRLESVKPLTILGTDYPTPDGTCIRDYIHVLDIAKAHTMGLEYLLAGGASNAFNIGHGSGYSVKDIITACERITNLPIPILAGQRRPGDPSVLVASAEKLTQTLGWQPEYSSLDEIITTAWQWEKTRLSRS